MRGLFGWIWSEKGSALRKRASGHEFSSLNALLEDAGNTWFGPDTLE